MDFKSTNRIFGFISLLVSSAVYLMTVQDSVPFWDCGEFSAAAAWQQVPHPPGAPLFLMIAKLFHLLPFGDPGWRMNLTSVFSSAFTILLLYLITVKVINILRGYKPENIGETFAVCGSAFVGAMAFTFSDTFWFNAVESEVYAMATLFVALVIYLSLLWWEKADEDGHERYLLLIAYLIGLSTGVHLLAVLAIIPIVYLVYFRKYTFTLKSFLVASAIGFVIFGVVYPGIVKILPAFLAGHTSGYNEAREYTIDNSSILQFFAIGLILASIAGVYIGITKKQAVLTLSSFSFAVILLGYTSYTQILIRANTNTPMNENTPTTFSKLASYLGREQYGSDPSWPRRVKTEDYFVQRYNSRDENGEYIYGPWTQPGTKQVSRKDGTSITVSSYDNIDVMSELKYLWKYQMNHMFFRYLYWNFVGRASDEQDAPQAFVSSDDANSLNYNTGYGHLFPIRFFAIPLLIGLIGLIFHFTKDKKTASVFFLMFLLMGVLAAIAQQQQDPQPRERDYFYTGAFLLFAMWIGLGVYSIIMSLTKSKEAAEEEVATTIPAKDTEPMGLLKPIVVVLILTLLVPVNMAAGGWKMHDRTGNFIPFDYSYNILQSVENNAILFTNGDNDTFPLWFLQDVMGVRRDVRIVNLSLGNTLWYIEQLKNAKPWGAEKIPLSFSDNSLKVDEEDRNALSYDFSELKTISIPVSQSLLKQYTDDESIIASGKFETEFKGTPYGEQNGKQYFLYKVQDKLVYDILQQTKFERPVYYSITVGPDAFCGLETYFRYEGMALRICPAPQRTAVSDNYYIPVYDKTLLNIDNSDNFYTTQHYGFKLRNLNNPDVYYDPVHRRLMSQYRQLYFFVARDIFMKQKDNKKALVYLNTMEKYISITQFPMSFDFLNKLAKLYRDLGDESQAQKYADLCIKSSNEVLSNKKLLSDNFYYELSGYEGPFTSAYNSYLIKKDYVNAKDILNRFSNILAQSVEDAKNGSLNGIDPQRVMYTYYSTLLKAREIEILPFEDKKDYDGAIKKANEIIEELKKSPNELNNQIAGMIMMKVQELEAKKSGKTITNIDSLPSTEE